jgi:hypothetical protein
MTDTDRLHVDAEDIAVPKFDLVGGHVDDHGAELDELAHRRSAAPAHNEYEEQGLQGPAQVG